jgi:hypothetical protein
MPEYAPVCGCDPVFSRVGGESSKRLHEPARFRKSWVNRNNRRDSMVRRRRTSEETGREGDGEISRTRFGFTSDGLSLLMGMFVSHPCRCNNGPNGPSWARLRLLERNDAWCMLKAVDAPITKTPASADVAGRTPPSVV